MADPGLPAVAAALVSLATAAGAVAAIRRFGDRLPQARPNDRSLHERLVPRVGGLAIWAGFLPVAVLGPPAAGIATSAWLVPFLAVAAVSLADDWRGVPPVLRLAVHAAAAIFVAVALAPSSAPAPPFLRAVEVGALALAVAWSANLFNFMDGSDGMAGLMALCGFGAYAIAAGLAGAPFRIPLALAAASAPFLAVNVPPARAFMGDVGAVPLGFLAATMGIAGVGAGAWPGWFPLLVFLPFVADATATLVRRLAAGERVWEAHRTHYYQRLLQLGAGHRGTLAAYGAAMAGTAASALLALAVAPDAGWWALGAWAAIAAAFFARIDYHWNRKRPPS